MYYPVPARTSVRTAHYAIANQKHFDLHVHGIEDSYATAAQLCFNHLIKQIELNWVSRKSPRKGKRAQLRIPKKRAPDPASRVYDEQTCPTFGTQS